MPIGRQWVHVPGKSLAIATVIEPCHEKVCLQDFQLGPTQTRLYSHKYGQWLEISDLERSGIVLSI